MRTMSILAVALGLAIALPAHAESPQSGGPTKIGASVTVKKPVDIARLAKSPKRYVGKQVRLEGTVKEVCQGMGCWVRVVDTAGANFLAKSLDESILLPKDSAGRRIVVQGVVKEMAAANAEEHKKHDCAKEGHACPTPTYLVATEGIELYPGKD